MKHEEVLRKVRSQMELSSEVADVAEQLSDQALTLIDEEGISFEEYSKIGFLSHLFNMTARMERREHLTPIDQDVLVQLEMEPLRVADRVAAQAQPECSTHRGGATRLSLYRHGASREAESG